MVFVIDLCIWGVAGLMHIKIEGRFRVRLHDILPVRSQGGPQRQNGLPRAGHKPSR